MTYAATVYEVTTLWRDRNVYIIIKDFGENLYPLATKVGLNANNCVFGCMVSVYL